MTDMIDQDPSKPELASTAADEMAKYGIVRVPVDYFHVAEYRYGSLTDAIAEAKRRLASAAAT